MSSISRTSKPGLPHMASSDGAGLWKSSDPLLTNVSMLTTGDSSPELCLRSGARLDLCSARTNTSEQPLVQVKNTFIHVEDEEAGIQFCRSKSDKRSDRPLAPRRMSYDGLHLAGGASSSAKDTGAPCEQCKSDKSWDRASSLGHIHEARFEQVPDVSSFTHYIAACCSVSPTSEGTAVNDPFGLDDQDPDDQDAPAEWSVGSAQHDVGRCKPCSFHASKGCTKGLACKFCHLPHQRKIRTRPNKEKREQCKLFAEILDRAYMGNQQVVEDQIDKLCLEFGAGVIDTSYFSNVFAAKRESEQRIVSSLRQVYQAVKKDWTLISSGPSEPTSWRSKVVFPI